MKTAFKILHHAAQIGLSIWWGIHVSSVWQGYIFFSVWETSAMLLSALLAVLVASYDN